MYVKLCQRHIIEVLMNVAEMEAIIGGYHGDAFSVLGPHPVRVPKGVGRTSGKATWEIRAFLPQAKNVTLLVDAAVAVGSGQHAKEIAMEKRHKEGFFVAELM